MEFLAAIVFALFIWWFSTGLILYLDGLPRATFAWSMTGATIILVAALAGLVMSAADATPTGAFVAFTCAVVCWGWQEMTLYLGLITGPRRGPAAPGARGWTRLIHATQAILYHEVAILVMGLLIVALTWAGANQVGMWTYMILWWMRLSAKFNIFLGVPNHSAEFLPQQIAYLESYFKKQSMNLLFPVSVTVATAATVLLLVAAGRADAGSFEQASLTLLGALCALALLEHWFFVLPIDVTKLWGWGFASRDGGPAASETDEERPRWDRDKVASAEKVVYRAGAV